MKLTPLTNKVLIEKVEIEKIGSIYVPEIVDIEQQSGKVLAVGNKVDLSIKPGDTVYFPKYCGLNFKLEDKKYFMIEDVYILSSN